MSNIKGGAKRLATSYAESAVIRTAIKPVIVSHSQFSVFPGTISVLNARYMF